MGFSDLLLRLRALRSRDRAEGDLDDELKFHLEMEARKKRLDGLPEADARHLAHAEFGGVAQVQEQCRDIRGLTFLENLGRDIRYGWRVLRKTPVFTAVAVLSLAIGIGANTAIFSLVDTVLLRLLPVRSPEQLVVLKWSANRGPRGLKSAFSFNDGEGRFRTNVFSWSIFTDLRARSQTLAGVFAFAPLPQVNVAANGEARMTGGMLVSGNYFSALGVGTVLGRPIVDDDDTVDGAPAAVISYRFWERAFGLDPAAAGKTIYINRVPFTVVGVTPRAYFGVSAGGFILTPEINITIPIRARNRLGWNAQRRIEWYGSDLFWVQAMGRLKPGADPRASQAELSAILGAGMPAVVARDQKAGVPRVEIIPGGQGLDFLRRDFHEPLLILMAVVGMVLLMTCANLAGMLLARATARRKEIAVRLAMGAGRLRLVRQLLIEGALLSAGGAVAGLLLAGWSVRALLALLATGMHGVAFEVRPDARILGFTAGISVLTTVLFALAPALGATRQDVASGLKADTPLAAASHRFRPVRALLAVQIAVALVLLVGATLFTRSLANLRSIPLGFNPQKLVLFGVTPGANGYDETRGNRLYSNLLDRLKRIPGVTGATLSVQTPLSGYSSNDGIRIAGDDSPRGRNADLNFVGPDFLEVLQIPVILGRGIDQRDTATAPRVAVISETAARDYFGGSSPVGQKFRWVSEPDWEVEVVGVVKDAKYDRLTRARADVVYVPYTQFYNGWLQEMYFELRTAGDPAAVISAARAAVRELDRMLPLVDVKTMEGQIDEALAQQRLFASLVSLFGTITLVLACVGLYGLVSYSVASRTREIGVRMALGADRFAVLRMVIGQVAVTTALGLLAGIPATRALTRFVESQLYGIHAGDVLSLAIAAAAVLLVAMLAAFIPARRAMRIDPVRALRWE
ncbi:conserved membrane hypothetical protein [Candidatus Sulfopaludibacter sp. SbA4]|nr:conserved membrane hypothetical protein [Candidatus Sulfopaludibacter sp. SbA4]